MENIKKKKHQYNIVHSAKLWHHYYAETRQIYYQIAIWEYANWNVQGTQFILVKLRKRY